jgi:hypothetical protein
MSKLAYYPDGDLKITFQSWTSNSRLTTNTMCARAFTGFVETVVFGLHLGTVIQHGQGYEFTVVNSGVWNQ